MIAFAIATMQEARPLLTALGAPVSEEDKKQKAIALECRGTRVLVAIVGMGKRAALSGARTMLDKHNPTEVINLGIAGALKPGLEIGRLYRVHEAVDWPGGLEAPERCAPGRFGDLPSARLVTSTDPVFSDDESRKLRPFGDLVDMEGAVIARVCREKGISLTALKCVSDFARDGDRETLRQNIDRLSQRLADLVIGKMGLSETL